MPPTKRITNDGLKPLEASSIDYTRTHNSQYGPYTTTSNGYAYASLETAQLKTLASMKVENLNPRTPTNPTQSEYTNTASASASFGDEFTTLKGNSPFVWDNNKATFRFEISGSTIIPAEFPIPDINQSNSKNIIYTDLSLRTYKSGYAAARTAFLDAELAYISNPSDEGYDAYSAAYDTYADAADYLKISSKNWFIGDKLTPQGWFWDNTHEQIQLDNNGTATVSYEFTPGADFEWELLLYSTIVLDENVQNANVLMDFSHTIKTLYIAPVGTTTISASGFLPNNSSITPVPEADTYAMLLAGLGVLGLVARRKKLA